MKEQVINRNVDEYISFLKEKCDFFNSISSDTDYLYSKINNLKNTQLDVVLDFYKDSIYKDSTIRPVNLLRLFILKCIKNGKYVDAQFVQEAKDNFNQKNIKFFKGYLDSNALEKIRIYTTKKNGDPLLSYKNPFRIFYVYFYNGELKKTTKTYLNAIGDELIKRLNLNDWVTRIVGFNGTQNEGQDIAWISLYPARFKNHNDAIQIFCTITNKQLRAGIHKGENVSNDTLDEETIGNEYDNFESVIQGLENQKDIAVKLNNSLDGDWNSPSDNVKKTLTDITKNTEYVNELESIFDISKEEEKEILNQNPETLKEKFSQFLVNAGFSVQTPSGNPSTTYDYTKRIEWVCKEESLSWEELLTAIDDIVIQYDKGGIKENLGKQSKSAVINALKQYQLFSAEQDTLYYEGNTAERTILQKTRNQKIVKDVKKRDKYTCRGCGFYFDNKIVEAHHLIPISSTEEEKQVKKDDLITLCPNCHAIAHILLKRDKKYQKIENLINELQEIYNR
ncbi:MAG: HNH endonuclease [Finegoldia magna]|nr:HNH endonuclease [Finegoldia magna]